MIWVWIVAPLLLLGCTSFEKDLESDMRSFRARCIEMGAKCQLEDARFQEEFENYIRGKWAKIKLRQSYFCDEVMFRNYVIGSVVYGSSSGSGSLIERDCSRFVRQDIDSVVDDMGKEYGQPTLGR